MTETAHTEVVKPRGSMLKTAFSNQQVVLLLFLALMVAFFAWRNSIFWSQSVLSNVLNDWSPIVLVAIGETFVVIAGGIDLSIGSNIAMSGVVAALAMKSMTSSGWGQDITLIAGAAIAIGSGAIVGVVNALLVIKGKLVPFVATLATLSICKGLAVVWTKGGPVGGGPEKAIPFSNPTLWAFSKPMIVVFGIVAIAGLLLHLNRFGRYTFAIGSNSFAARAAGINVNRHLAKVYIMSGALAGFAGMFFYLRLSVGSPSTGIGKELDAVAAVVIGGVVLTGGIGKIMGTALGALMLATVASGLIIIGVEANYRDVVVGALIALAGIVQGVQKLNSRAS